MYKNIGRKIKGFSIFFAWAIISLSCLYAFYRLFSSKMEITDIFITIGIIAGGSLGALFISWFLYAFGVIAEKAERIDENLETMIISIDELSNEINNLNNSSYDINRVKNTHTSNFKDNIPLENFKLPETREELFKSQMKKIKKDYEMSRITYDEYEESKKRLEQKYK